jgi:uncharacterized protein (TIGR03067 family)
MRRAAPVIVLLFALHGCQEKQKPAPDPAEVLLGTWKFETTLDSEGKENSRKTGEPKPLESISFEREKDQLVAHLKYEGGGKDRTTKVHIDANVTPNQIEFVHEDGKVVMGIYRLDGGKLILVTELFGKNRPAVFTTPDNLHWAGFVLVKDNK